MTSVKKIKERGRSIDGKYERELKWFTLVPDVLIQRYDLITAIVWGKVWRYCQMKDKVCRTSIRRIANELGITEKTVRKRLKLLIEEGYIKDMTPQIKRYRPHVYVYTEKIFKETDGWVAENERRDYVDVDEIHIEIDPEAVGTKSETVGTLSLDSRDLVPNVQGPSPVKDSNKIVPNIVEDINSEVEEIKSISPTSQAGKSIKIL